MKYTPRTKPFRHQGTATLKALRAQQGLGFFMDPGCGKTKAVLDTIACQALRGRGTRVLVLAPLTALSVWEDEIEEHFSLSASTWVAGDDKPQLRGVLDARPIVTFFLINYDKFRQRSRSKRGWEYHWVKSIEDWGPQIVVLDESHRVKRAGGVTSQAMYRFVQRLRARNARILSRASGVVVPQVYLMTGTPHPNGWQDLFAQFRVLDPSLFGTNKADFEAEYCIYGQQPHNKYRIVRYRNLAKLKRIVRENSYIISKEEALPWLPSQRWRKVTVALPAKARQKYEDMAEELVTMIEGGGIIEAANAGTRRLRLRQITGGFTTSGQVIHRAKLEVARDLLDDWAAQRESVVIYASFIPEVLSLRDAADEVGYEAYSIHGKVDVVDRTSARKRLQTYPSRVQDFKESSRSKSAPKPVALVFQVATGSLAITLTAATTVLFYSLPDNWEHYWQALQRVHRPGQTRGVVYHHLISPGTVDVSMLKALRGKANMHGELMGNTRAFVYGGV